jgi:phosphatidylglycerophosphatase A
VTTNPSTDATPVKSKPHISYFLATACGLGYLKPGPGTWGSLMGLALSILVTWLGAHKILSILRMERSINFWTNGWIPGGSALILVLVVAAIGVIVADNVEKQAGATDPQFVVIDEVSGQLIALSLPFIVLNWKTWLLGFILFRVFDIWKPFPARQAESLHGGWGIMADDWIAGVYAGLVIYGVQAFGLLK